MLSKTNILFLLIFFLIFFSTINYATKINEISYNHKNTICINLKERVSKKLSQYIKSGIPFDVSIKITLKERSGLFFLKDKVVKQFNENFKFSYDIIKKWYIIAKGNKIKKYKELDKFLAQISTICLKNFIPLKLLNNKSKFYFNFYFAYTPVKGSFSIKNIYIFPKINDFIFEKKINLEELIGNSRKN